MSEGPRSEAALETLRRKVAALPLAFWRGQAKDAWFNAKNALGTDEELALYAAAQAVAFERMTKGKKP